MTNIYVNTVTSIPTSVNRKQEPATTNKPTNPKLASRSADDFNREFIARIERQRGNDFWAQEYHDPIGY